MCHIRLHLEIKVEWFLTIIWTYHTGSSNHRQDKPEDTQSMGDSSLRKYEVMEMTITTHQSNNNLEPLPVQYEAESRVE